jgi:hypothetical protein
MQIIAISEATKTATLEKAKAHLPEEVRDTISLYLKDVIRDFYYRSDITGVVFMMECESLDEARAELAGLKLVKEGMLTFNLIPVQPLKPLGILLADAT